MKRYRAMAKVVRDMLVATEGINDVCVKIDALCKVVATAAQYIEWAGGDCPATRTMREIRFTAIEQLQALLQPQGVRQ
jgi:hypothetical protein